MFVEFWNVGTRAAGTLPMTNNDICVHLLADWIPSLPAAVSSSFVGWPPFLVLALPGSRLLALRAEAGRSERQWKGILSWMLGVASTRHVLKSEGYRWIAPLSAFYPEAAQAVDISTWHPSYPRSSVTADRQPGSRSRLRPDYIAIRPLGDGPLEWAVAESKGTRACLTNMHSCPPDWYNQARNVLLRVDGSPISVPRHLVIATRVNPSARYDHTRRIQVRVWNSAQELPHLPLPGEGAADVAAAHLFGFFSSVGLTENARALALSVQMRAQTRHAALTNRQNLDEVSDRADHELREPSSSAGDGEKSVVVSVETNFGQIRVEIASATISLARRLRHAENAAAAEAALREGDAQLNVWKWGPEEMGHRARSVNLSFGVKVRLPHTLNPG
jgi:hypothetical protein